MKITVILLTFISLLITACQSITVIPTPSPTTTGSPPETVEATATPFPTPSPVSTVLPTATVLTSSPAPAPVVRDGPAILGLVGQPQTLNPITESSAALRELRPLLFDTLLQLDPETASLQPGLAQSWEYSENGRQVIFHLRPNLTWSDGSPITAASLAESLQATRHPALDRFWEFSPDDDQTLSLRFINIDCGAVTTLAQLPLLPASQILDAMPMGSGPYMVADWSEDKRTLSLVRNPNYHGEAPSMDELTVRFIPENEIDIALSEGQFDAIGPFQFNLPHPIPSYLRDIAYPAPQMIYVAINYDPRDTPPLAPEARQALLYALDRQAILTEVLAGGDGQLLAGSLLPSHWAANNALSPPPYDPDEARNLLAEAGLTDRNGDGWLDQDNQRLELFIRTDGNNPLQQKLSWLVSSYYRDLGLYVRPGSTSSDNLLDDLFTHDFRLAMYSWFILPDPDQRLYWHSDESTEGEGLNLISYNNPALDDLLEQGVEVPGCQPEARAEIYRQIQDILSQERPVDFLLAPNQHFLIADRLSGLEPGPFAPITWNVGDWRLE